MRSFSSRRGDGGSEDHRAAVERRLALLAAELESVRSEAREAGLEEGDADRPDPWEPRAPGPPGYDGQPHGPSMPGRHASRRPPEPAVSEKAVGLLPESLRGRFALGPAQLSVIAVVVAIGLAVTTWWVLRGQPEVVEPVVVETPSGGLATPAAGSASGPAVPSQAPSQPSPSGETEAGGEVVVDVAGKVRKPGIVVLPTGSRVADAIEAAGGRSPGVNLTSLNLARQLVDGEQVLVGVKPPPGYAGAPPPQPGASATAPALVNINTADSVTLETLPRVGPVTAAAIIAWREANGGFTSIDELLEVDGIGDATLAQLTPHVTL